MLTWLSVFFAATFNFVPQRLKVEGRIIWAEAADFNRDGAPDIVVAFRRGSDPDTKRFAAFFFQQPDGSYPERPNEERPLPKEAAIATVADCDGDGSAELVLLTSTGVIAYTGSGGSVSAVPVQWVSQPTATLFPEPENLPIWDMCSDFHKSGKPELAVWDIGTLSFYRFVSGRWQAGERLRIAPVARHESATSGTFRGGPSNRDLSIATHYIYPELAVGDYDGDGKADLFAIAEENLRVYGGNGDRFSEHPTVALDFTLRTPDERHRRNAYVNSQAIDLNGDGKTDFVLTKVSGGLSSMKSETAIHLNKGGFAKKPDQLVKRDGFAAMVQFTDLNKDGKPEMIEPSAEVGLVTLARAMVSRAIAVDWLVTPNHNGTFALDHSAKINIKFGLDFSGGPMFKGPFPRVSHDFDGDGLLDFLASPDGESLQVFLGKKDGFFDAEAALSLKVETSPFTAPFYDARAKKVHVVSFFRDTPGKEGRIMVMLNK